MTLDVQDEIPPAHRDDLLVVGWLNEAAAYPQFRHNQVICVNAAQRLVGMRFRRAYYTPDALSQTRTGEFFEVLARSARLSGNGEIKPVENYWSDYIRDEEAAIAEVLAEAEAILTEGAV